MTKKLSILFLLFALTSTAVFAQNCQALFSTQPTTFATTWQFTDMSTSNPGNPPVSNWFWDFGDGNTSNQQNPTHTYNTPGAFLVCLTITAGNCTSVYCDTAGYAVGPNCSVTGTGSVSGNTVSFGTTTQSSGTPVSYAWDFGDGNSTNVTTSTVSHTYASNGFYNATVTVTFSDTCTASDNLPVQIGPPPSTCNAVFTSSSSGSTVNFSDNSTASSAILTWTWDFGDGSAPVTTTSGTTSHTYSGNGPYLACLSIFTIDSCTSSYCDTVTTGGSNSPCQAGFIHYPDTTGQYTIIAINTTQGQNVSYFWDFGDGNTSTNPYPIHQYAGAGTYNICLTVVDSLPSSVCTSVFCDSVTVTQKINAPFTFAVLNGASNVEPATRTEFKLWPNPAHNQVNLSFELTQATEVGVQLMDLQGRAVRTFASQEMAAGAQQLEMSTDGLSSSLYLMQVRMGDKIVVKKLLID